jgi:hypothetical protein
LVDEDIKDTWGIEVTEPLKSTWEDAWGQLAKDTSEQPSEDTLEQPAEDTSVNPVKDTWDTVPSSDKTSSISSDHVPTETVTIKIFYKLYFN